MEKQMTIDDYLNRAEVVTLDSTEVTTESAESIEPELVDYTKLTKDELIKIIEQNKNTLTSIELAMDDIKEKHAVELTNMQEFYKKKTTELSKIVAYYERKLGILKDIINIETGGER